MYKTTAKIDGMACGMCEAHVNETVRKAFAVEKIESTSCQLKASVIFRHKRRLKSYSLMSRQIWLISTFKFVGVPLYSLFFSELKEDRDKAMVFTPT